MALQQELAINSQLAQSREKLDALGGASLFWGEHAGPGETHSHLVAVRARVEAFDKRVREIEDRRDGVLEEIAHAQEDTELFEDDLFEARLQEERRKREWKFALEYCHRSSGAWDGDHWAMRSTWR
jgi:hypothetical protein